MSEEPKNIRLSKAAKECNVGMQNIVELLAKKGHIVENSPNAKITPEQYAIISAAFQRDREAKAEADSIEITTGPGVVSADAPLKDDEDEAKTDELVIKDITDTKGHSEPANQQPAEALPEEEDEDDFDEPIDQQEDEPRNDVPTEEQPQEEAPVAPAPAAAEPDASAEPAEAPADNQPLDPQEEAVVTSDSKEDNDTLPAGLHVMGKIDLTSLNTKTRPDKKSKQQKKEERAKAQQAAKPAPAPMPEPKVEQKPNNQPASQPAPAPKAAETTPAADNKNNGIEFVPPQYTKLEGLKTIGKIDLSQFGKVTPPNGPERRKRKRVKGEKVDQNAEVQNANRAAKEEKKKQQEKNNQGNNNSGNNNNNNNANSNQNRNNDKANEKKAKKKEKKAKEVKVEVDDAEVEKQIRDTLARLSPMGKSKTSKHNREKRQKVAARAEEEMMQEMESQKVLQVTEFVTANELATMMNVPVTKIIATCMSVGIFVSINQRLDAEAIKLVVEEFGFEVNFVSNEVAEAIHNIEEEDRPEDLVPRTPIITVMGHVDHGKTSLLDYIRKTNVIAGEAGGITQHIGAYEVTMPDERKITFLDTPGHEAFTAMRARGAKVTDIAIIVIAADDKIMPQTIEAINHAQAAAVPMVFAINKIDKPGADPDRIKTELANMNLLVEEWGGKYQSQDISAKKGLNVDLLLEKVLLEAEMLELKGNPKKRAKGTVLECSLDKGRGYVAKLLVENGTIRQGDPLVAGPIAGRVKAMYNERNQLVKEAGPSQPVLLLGLTGACQAGDTFNVTENEREAKEIASKRQQLQREQGLRTTTILTLDEIGRRRALGDFHEIKLIVKGDVDGSVEALSDSLIKLSTEEIQINVIHKAVGQITEGDVLLAEASDAIIIGFQVRPSVQARKMAEEHKIDIRLYSVIYDAINELHDAMEGMLAPETQEKIVANLEIRETFKISKVGTIAGCMCLDGKIQRSHNVRIIRDGIVVFTGKLASLKRFKDDVKEVVSGQDCGLNIENFNDIKVGDIVEAYEVIEIKRKL